MTHRTLLFALPLIGGMMLCALTSTAQNATLPLPLPATAEELCLIPTPQQATLSPGHCTLPAALRADRSTALQSFLSANGITATPAKQSHSPRLVLQQVDSLPVPANMEEAYVIDITPQRILIQSTAPAGAMMASYTLTQLHEAYGNTLPCLHITDWPAYAWRGWMDDISRGPIPTPLYMQKEFHLLARYKMNFWNFYTEHTLRNPQYPDVAPGNGLDKAELSTSFPYGTLHAMANLQCLAHAEKTLRIPFYQPLADSRSNFNPGNEETYRYLGDLLRYAADTAYHGCQFFNIDCDETEGLGSGKGKDYVQAIGADEAYCRHVSRVCELLRPYDKKILMWGDIVAKHPEMIRRLPKELQYIVWNYAPQENYTQCLAPFAEAHEQQGIAIWVAPAVAHYAMMLANPRSYMQNIACLARDGLRAGATGLMNTAWDDSGEALFDNTWHGMLWAAEMAWHPIADTNPEAARQELSRREDRFNHNVNALFFQGSSFAMLNSSTIEELNGFANKEDASSEKKGSSMESSYQLPQTLKGKDFTSLLYRTGALESNPDIADWCHSGALYEPLYNFYPSLVDSAMALRTTRALLTLGTLEQELTAASDLTDHGLHSPMKHALYAVHRMQATAHKCQLRRQIYLSLHDSVATDICRAAAQRYFHEIYALKKEYLRLWDAESRDYSRQIVCNRFDALGQEALQIDRHIFFSVQNAADGQPQVSLRTLFDDKPIYYTLDGRTPTDGAALYASPFPLQRSCLVQAIAYDDNHDGVTTSQYLLHHTAMGRPVALATPFSTYRDTYSGGGNNALTDGQLGSNDSYNDGHWQGYWGQNIDAAIDLAQPTAIHNVSIRFLQNTFDWVLAPKEIQLYTSTDGTHWTLARTEHYEPEFAQGGNIIHTDALRNLSLTTRYLRIVALNPGPLPDWHPSKGQPSYMFADEIVVE